MKLNSKGINLIKKHETLMLKPYLCPRGVPTIGYGNTYYFNDVPVKMSDNPISKNDAELLFNSIVSDFSKKVYKLLDVELNDNQFNALVSFAYNVGVYAFSKSTLLKIINNNPNDKNIGYQFYRWNKSNGVVLRGLVNRRKSEYSLYCDKYK